MLRDFAWRTALHSAPHPALRSQAKGSPGTVGWNLRLAEGGVIVMVSGFGDDGGDAPKVV